MRRTHLNNLSFWLQIETKVSTNKWHKKPTRLRRRKWVGIAERLLQAWFDSLSGGLHCARVITQKRVG